MQRGTVGAGRDWQTGKVIRPLAAFESYDLLTGGILLALAVTALFTFKDYAISNDEGVQHHYGELIIAYYRSGLASPSKISTFTAACSTSSQSHWPMSRPSIRTICVTSSAR